MSAPQGCTDDMAVVESFKEALKGRIGAERYRMWFAHGVDFDVQSAALIDDGTATEAIAHGDASDSRPSRDKPFDAMADASPTLVVSVRGQFALDRLRKNFLSEIRGAAMQACGTRTEIRFCLVDPPAQQVPLPLSDESREMASQEVASQEVASQEVASQENATARRRPSTRSLSRMMVGRSTHPGGDRQQSASATSSAARQPSLLPLESDPVLSGEVPADSSAPASAGHGRMTAANFITGPCNRLAHTAMTMVCQNLASASPLFLFGPTGTGKTHLLAAIADQLRRRHRMRRVIHLSAEQFTNDFISSVGNSGITAFRRRYREVDALLIDDVQFLGAKKATLREMLYTVETVAGSGRPLVFAGSHSPNEIEGLTSELAGRMAAGLVCSLQPMDRDTRESLFRRWLQERCAEEIPESLIEPLLPMLASDGRVISGIVNVINTLQRMYRRSPSLDEVRQFAGPLLRSSKPLTTLAVIESAVCDTFNLPSDSLRGRSHTRAVTGPRMLAMYLSRQLTSAAYAEISRHYGGRSHSTAISAEQHVKTWLAQGSEVGRGHGAMTAREAIARVESLLRSG